MKIMCRSAEDDFVALKTAQGMENAGASVFSITYNGTATHFGALAPHSRLIVWAKVPDGLAIDIVDKSIDKEMGD